MLIRNDGGGRCLSPGKHSRRLIRSFTLYYLLAFSCVLQPFLVKPVQAKLDFMTKLKLIGLIALGSKKVSIVPFPLPIPIPIHIEGKEEIIYVQAPPARYSSAYSYPKGPMYEYSSGPGDHGHSGGYGKGYPKSPASHKPHHGYKSSNADYAAHASEAVPVATSFRYGDRISAQQQSQQHSSNGGNRPTRQPPTPNNRGHRNNRNYNYRPVNNEIVVPPTTTTTTTTPAPIPQSQQYDYPSPYSTQYEQSQPQQPQEQSRPDNNQQPLRIALIPIKSLNLDNLDGQSPYGSQQQQQHQYNQQQQQQQQPQQQQVNVYTTSGQSDNQLPENLVNYIRQVQNSLSSQSSQEDRPSSSEDQSGEQTDPNLSSSVEYSDPSSNSDQQYPATTESVSQNQPEEPVTEPVELLKQPQQSNSFNSIPTQHFQTIHSNQFPEIPSKPFSSFPSSHFSDIPNKSQKQPVQFPSIQSSWQSNNNYNPSSYVPHYKAPELKVIRTRYNPKQQQQHENQFPTFQKPVVSPFVSYSSSLNNNAASPAQSPVQNSQFLYTVSHQSSPSVPSYFSPSQYQTSLQSPYPSIDNFGLAQFQASQSKQQHPKRSNQNMIASLSSAASFEVPTWITSPSSLFPKSSVRNPFRFRSTKQS